MGCGPSQQEAARTEALAHMPRHSELVNSPHAGLVMPVADIPPGDASTLKQNGYVFKTHLSACAEQRETGQRVPAVLRSHRVEKKVFFVRPQSKGQKVVAKQEPAKKQNAWFTGPDRAERDRAAARAMLGIKDIEDEDPADQMEDTVHKKFENYWELGALIGQGSFATVHACQQKNNWFRVPWAPKTGSIAVKTIAWDEVPSFREMVTQMRRWEHLPPHANILPLLHFYGEHNSATHLHLMLPEMRGGDLFDRVLDDGSLSEKEAATYVEQMASGLAFLHSEVCALAAREDGLVAGYVPSRPETRECSVSEQPSRRPTPAHRPQAQCGALRPHSPPARPPGHTRLPQPRGD
eukprot:TRINITY_DN15152_c0_g1_i3.p1 TRINITY_DN15152_c0_g1~~TRINITY_DN15152_c0_g1_i3.p1  ORF type:complete len:351 (-),score=55.27 TRINITY_DN15152_c0_g1_i3:236-1288(-)